MFDPEKVELFDGDRYEGCFPRGEEPTDCTYHSDGPFVLKSDYDRLLEIHLRHVGMIADLFKRCGEPLSEDKIVSLKNGTWH